MVYETETIKIRWKESEREHESSKRESRSQTRCRKLKWNWMLIGDSYFRCGVHSCSFLMDLWMHDFMIHTYMNNILKIIYLKLMRTIIWFGKYDHDHRESEKNKTQSIGRVKCVNLCVSIYNRKLCDSQEKEEIFIFSRKCTRRTLMSCYEFVPFLSLFFFFFSCTMIIC